MEVSQKIKSTQHPVPSPDGSHIAVLTAAGLEIRSASSFELIRRIQTSSQGPFLCWSPIQQSSDVSSRILLADENNARIWDLLDEKWTATINNGTGGMGRIVNACFGRTRGEVLCFSDFGSKVTAWSLETGRSVEIRDPKFPTRGFGFRAVTGLFALLSRPVAQDILTLHAPSTYFVLKTISLPSVDAAGIKWSPDGKWLAVWDTPSTGYKIYIYTADGHLYRIYSGDSVEDGLSLGVKSLEWSPSGDCLAIGGHDRKVTLLSSRTFSPVMFLDHTASIQLASGYSVWLEQVSASSQRSYATVSQPIAPPTAAILPPDQAQRSGLSIIAFNADGTLVATREDSAPTTIWIWDLTKLVASAALIHHSPVRHLSWHTTIPSLLLIQCSHEDPTVYFYNSATCVPYSVQIPIQRSHGKLEAKWLPNGSDHKPALLFGDAHGCLVAWPEGRVQVDDLDLTHSSEKSVDGLDESEDSLYEILTGRSPSKPVDSTELLVSEVLEEATEIMDDTFGGRQQFGFT